jgi:hypothetical protein
MVSSGTFNFNPATSDLILSAFARLQMRRTELLQEHLIDAANEANFALVRLSNLQPNLWTADTQQLTITQGVPTYTLAPETISILIATLVIDGTPSNPTESVLGPISTTEYFSQPNKAVQAPPTTFWFDRQITPKITFWQTPDRTYTVNYRRLRQIQDATAPGGLTMDLPFRWLDAFVAELSYRLCRIYKPELMQALKLDAAEAWDIAANQDQEQGISFTIAPQLGGYFR